MKSNNFKKIKSFVYLLSCVLILANLICLGAFIIQEYNSTAPEDRSLLLYLAFIVLAPGVMVSTLVIMEFCFCLISFLSRKRWYKNTINVVCLSLILVYFFNMSSHIMPNAIYNYKELSIFLYTYLGLRVIYCLIWLIEIIFEKVKTV